MNEVRIGIVGIGNMGSVHAKNIVDGKIQGLKLTAVCDIDAHKRTWAKENLGEEIALFTDYKEMIKSGYIDAVLIATPHYIHPDIAIYGFSKGLHVLTEKPAGVYTKQVEAMNVAAKEAGTVFGVVYNQRTNPLYKALKKLIDEGKLGELKRCVWIITNWYRTQAYYDSGSWRATWAGEGGGVLINQCPHNLDLWQWLFGMPSKVTGFTAIGKYHHIEVEDDVTAYTEYDNGATAVFITTTGECPGTNRLEISGDRGKAVIEEGVLKFYELEQGEREYCFTSQEGFGSPKMNVHNVEGEGIETGHNGILQNFTNAILYGEKLIAPGEEAIRGLTISNAIHLSSWLGQSVELPINADLYLEKLQEKIADSKVKPEVTSKISDLQGTYNSRWDVR